ncbi:sensor histidine kinase [Herbaspirillum sp. WKF16]|uniref:sensor histidine kinase n=1 Tax=Herbaspirillum sp. WKF16 TaxID=3028312 RepID=UPI0023A9EC89|nr:ATP-binding protein [Herbaspirillum sp. WKF16]WDZ96668.1 sensor histidine kinase [Herbaspirillum sp. WKF16]
MRADFALRAWLALSCLLGACAAPAATAGVVHLARAESMSVAPSQYQPPSSTIDAATLAGPWTAVTLPHTSTAAPGPGKPGAMATTWYRVSLAGIDAAPGPMALHLLRWQAAGQLTVYGDGRLLYRSQGSPVWNHFRHPALVIPLRQTDEAPLPRTLLLRLDTYPGAAGAVTSMYAGPQREIYARYALREWLEYQFPFMASVAFLAVGLFSLGIWAVRRREPIYFLVFAIAACTVTRRWHFYAGLEQLSISDQWFGWLTYNALNWQIVALQYFARLLHGRDHRWFNRATVAFALLMTLVTLPMSALQYGLVLVKPMLYVVPILLGAVMTARNMWDGWRSRSYEARLLGLWMIVSLSFGTYDWFKVKYQFNMEGFYLTPYAAMVMFVVITYILFRRYVNAVAETERGKETLALRLQARERELEESYRKLAEVEKSRTLSMERQRMMQDMHDVLGLSLIGALRMVERGKLDEREVSRILSSCIDDLKLAIDSLEPVDADLLLLLATLRFRLGPRLEAAGIRLLWKVETVPALPWLDPRHALHILRILQEAFANIIKHTGASEIAVSTAVGADSVSVTVQDNGPGFSLEQGLAQGGKGLRNQLRRAEAIGARIRWQAAGTGQPGTRMVLHLPLAAHGAVGVIPEQAAGPA